MHIVINRGLEGMDLKSETPSHFVDLHGKENKILGSEMREGKEELSLC
jgi:hypothetical protein